MKQPSFASLTNYKMCQRSIVLACLLVIPNLAVAASQDTAHLEFQMGANWLADSYGSTRATEVELTGVPHPPPDYSQDATFSIRCSKTPPRLGIALKFLKYDALFDARAAKDGKIVVRIGDSNYDFNQAAVSDTPGRTIYFDTVPGSSQSEGVGQNEASKIFEFAEQLAIFHELTIQDGSISILIKPTDLFLQPGFQARKSAVSTVLTYCSDVH